MPPDLSDSYYLDNFTTLLDFVDGHYTGILNASERRFSEAFRAATEDARRLYVRLISRRGPHFRRDKLHYPEIGSIDQAAHELAEAGLLMIDDPGDRESLIALLDRHELERLIREAPERHPQPDPLGKIRKPGLQTIVLDHYDATRLQTALQARFSWYTPLGQEQMQVYRLLFFGNLSQDLSDFVISDLGHVIYEDYEIHRQDRLFDSRGILDDTLTYLKVRTLMYEALESGDGELLRALPDFMPDPKGEPSLVRRRDKILNRCGRFFESQKEDDTALGFYGRSERPPARERCTRIYARRGDYQTALELCETIRQVPRDEGEAHFVRHLEPRLKRKIGLNVSPVKRLAHPTSLLDLPPDPEQRVESLVLESYRRRDVDGFFAENRFWLGLFGIAFWDIVFMPIRGAFFNRFQRGPVGLFSTEFRRARRQAIEDRLARIAGDPAWPQEVLATYDQKYGLANLLVVWPRFTRESVALVLARFERAHLVSIFDRLAKDPGQYRSGFPDLVVFEGNSFGYELVEVKGPGDQLQENQRRWLRYLKEQGVPYRVAKVTWDVN